MHVWKVWTTGEGEKYAVQLVYFVDLFGSNWIGSLQMYDKTERIN